MIVHFDVLAIFMELVNLLQDKKSELLTKDHMIKHSTLIEHNRRDISSCVAAKMQHISVLFVDMIWKKYLEEWFVPSIKYKIQHHFKPVEKLKYMHPVNKIVQEIAFQDTQNARKPENS